MIRSLRDFIALNAGIEPVGLPGSGWRASVPMAALVLAALRNRQLEKASMMDSNR